MSPADHVADLPRYRDWRPTSMDAAGVGLDDRQDWIVVPIGRNRDSGFLELSNFHVILSRHLGGEGDHVEVHRFGHWACGWLEIILVSPDAPPSILESLGTAVCALANYPILDEEHHSALECDGASTLWEHMRTRDRVEYVTRAGGGALLARKNLDRMYSENPEVYARVWDRLLRA